MFFQYNLLGQVSKPSLSAPDDSLSPESELRLPLTAADVDSGHSTQHSPVEGAKGLMSPQATVNGQWGGRGSRGRGKGGRVVIGEESKVILSVISHRKRLTTFSTKNSPLKKMVSSHNTQYN